MSNIIDYIVWRGDISTQVSPFNDIDCLILSQIAMINFKGIIPPPFESGKILLRNAAELYFGDEERSAESLGYIIPPETKELFRIAGESKRFGEMMLSGYVGYTNVSEEVQFAALSVEVGDGSILAVFRGTDDTLVGWKEDFNLSFLSPIPAQTEAKKYVEDVSTVFGGDIRVGGHSKGGNLAVYAATKADIEVQKRIIAVYNHDAPGFSREFLSSEEFLRIEDKVKTVVPQSSLVGMLFENKGDYQIVKSSMTGIFQHNPFSWELSGSRFVTLDELTEDGKRISGAANAWMEKMNVEQRREFVDAVYRILIATEATTLTELNKDKYAIVRALRDTDKETRKMVFSTFGMLIDEGGRLFRNSIFNSIFKKDKAVNASEEESFDRAYAEAKETFSRLGEHGDIPDIAESEAKPGECAERKDAKRATAKREIKEFYVKDNGIMTRAAIAARRAVLKKTRKK